MARPAITVLLPTYNRRKYLPRAVKCIVDQTFTDWRLIVVNDGGEAVGDIVASFNDPRIEYVSLQHKGKAGALNAALGMVESEYVAYMDDDDEVFPEHLQVLYDSAVSSNSGFVYSDTWLRIVDSRTGAVLKEYVENDLDVTADMLRVRNYINHKQVLHRRELAERIGGFDEELPILIDFDFIRRLAAVESPLHVRKVTGRHILWRSDGTEQSITGLWKRDPAACGTALLRIFGKTPADLARCYQMLDYYVNKDSKERQVRQLGKEQKR